MTAGTPVTLSKLSTDRNPAGDETLRAGYWLKGTLLFDLTIGQHIHVARTARSGRAPGEPELVQIPGLFESSAVQSLETREDGSIVVTTQNSHWLIEVDAR